MKKKHQKSAKQSKIITQQLKAIENPNIDDIKSVNIEHPKSLQKLSKIIREVKNLLQMSSEKVSNIHLYNATKKNVKNFWTKKKVKIPKKSHSIKGYASSYIIDILNCFNFELKF